ncbi:uncharacterized protein LOC115261171 [Aedes albopictus]|uniref:CCHC-type domain-containing protein n=1 Tax=Aedes albopictus TaxID=7160 RepID=A0ABM2A577_AEDAL
MASKRREFDNGAAETPARKSMKKASKWEAVMKELSESKVLNVQMKEELNKARETIASLQVSLNTPRSETSEVRSEEFIGGLGPSSTHRHGPQAGESNAEMTRFMSSVNQISVSSISVPECKPSFELEEIGRHDFEVWKDLLTDSMKLAGVSDEATQFIVFKVKAGQKLLDVFKNTKSVENAPNELNFPFSNAMYRLNTYFSSGADVMLQRRKLALISQKTDESDVAFLMRVGAIARMCEFGDDKEFEEIARAVAEHAKNRDVRTTALKLLSRNGAFTDLVDKVRELETIRLNEDFFNLKHGKPDSVMVARVATTPVRQLADQRGRSGKFGASSRGRYVGQRYRYEGSSSGRGRGSGSWRGTTGAIPERCFRCHSLYHKSFNCSAVDKICLNCGGKGHLQRACRSLMRGDSSRLENERSSDMRASDVAAISKVEHNQVDKAAEDKVSEVV